MIQSEELRAIIRVCKEEGVFHLKMEGLELFLTPPKPPETLVPNIDEEILFAHMNGLPNRG